MAMVEPATALKIQATPKDLILILHDRREVRIAWENCSPLLASATEPQRFNAELSPGVYGIHWPDLDEDLSINGLLRDR
jgi:Protein of unknown function (DUF2442)